MLYSYKKLLGGEQNRPSRGAKWCPQTHKKNLKNRVFFLKIIGILFNNLIAKSIFAKFGNHKSNFARKDFKIYKILDLLFVVVFTESAHWADSVIELQCPSVDLFVCPLPMQFFSRPLIGPQVT